MKKIFTVIPLICFLITDISLAQNFRVPILVKDACNTSITIWLGVDPAGTDGFNPGLDTLAPPPPPGGFDARYRWLSEDYLTDIRGNSLTEKQFQMIYQKDVSCAPIKLYWNKAHLDSLGTFVMKDNITGTLWGPFDMTTTDSLIISTDLVYIQSSLRIMVTPDSWLEPPAPPGGLTAAAFSQTQINLSWTDNSNNEDGFKIERRIPPSTTWTEIATVSSNVTTYQNTGLTANTNYCYQVRAYNVGGNSAYSNEACATTLPNAPAAPGNLTAGAVNQTQINLAWIDNSNNEDGFKIERRIPPSTTWTEIATVGANVTTYQNTGLTANTSYCYQVRAYNTGGNSAYSNEVCAVTYPNIPASPSSLNATAFSQTQINLSWTDNSNNETGFYIERKLASLPTFIKIDSVNTNVISFSDSTISQGVSYNYRVCAYNISGLSGYSNSVYVTSILPAPGSLVGQLVTGPPYSVVLSWLDLSSNELGFVVERDTVGSGNFLVLDSVIANATGFIDTSFVFHLDTFYYRIYAYTEDTVSGYSNVANLIIPVELTSFYASVSDKSVIINWITATELNNKGFDLERRLQESWEQIAFLKGKGTTTEKSTYTFVDDFRNRSYKGLILYRLKQTDFSGVCSYSDAIAVDVNFTPQEFILYQNYPNPFNPATTVRYAVPYSGKVTITLYNTLGEKLDVLVDEIKEPGIYEIEFKSDKLGSGIYFYRIETEKFVKTNKMIFMK